MRKIAEDIYSIRSISPSRTEEKLKKDKEENKMPEEKKEQIEAIKTEDKKQKKNYIVIMLVAFLAGVMGGVLMSVLKDRNIIDTIAETVSFIIREGSLYFNFVFALLVTVTVYVLYQKSRKQYKEWDGEDEDAMEQIEKRLNIALVISGGFSVLYLIAMIIGFDEIFQWEKDTFQIGKLIIFIIGIVLSTVVITVSQQKIVNFVKEMNPEKKGSIYDSKFQEKWLESCDEAEKQAIYQSAFAAYKAVNLICLGLCIFCFLAMHLWNIGITPACMVGIIWLVSVLAYSIKAMQLESRK